MPRSAPVPAPAAGVARRTVLKAGAVGAAALGIAGLPPTAASAAGPVFRHGVASGDPLGDAVVLWTRVTPDDAATPGSGRGAPVEVAWEVAADDTFRQVVKAGSFRTDASRDHTVLVDVTGLTPYTRYVYRFRALGDTSPSGRTQTAGTDGVHALRMAFVSCSNYTGGYFSAYRHVAARDDLDLVLHLGDYVYEYGNGDDRYGPAALAGKRDHQPAEGDDHARRLPAAARPVQGRPRPAGRARALPLDRHLRRPRGLQRHLRHRRREPPGREGDFLARRRAAYQAYLEWMPIRMPDQTVPHKGIRFWRRFSFGPLADLSVIETRQNRSKATAGAAGPLFGLDLPGLTTRPGCSWSPSSWPG